jgi:murein DD-endopeptidase MepM/ murein hydrolase activator NlpD
VANHRAERRGSVRSSAEGRDSATPSTPGKRRATKPVRASRGADRRSASSRPHVGGRKNLFPALPSAPMLIGAAAVTLAAVGAVSVSQQATSQVASGSLHRLSAQAGALTGASGIASSDTLNGRHQALSRDSQREALQDAADEELQAAAEAQAKQRNVALAALAASAEKHANAIARNAWHLPVQPGAYHLTARFGQCSSLWSRCHTGLDFAAPSGTPIHSIANGVVTEVGYSGAYGIRTIVTLEDGTELWYCHQTSATVSLGEKVTGGELIGYVGSTGNVTGPHLHLEVRPGAGDPVDPYGALLVHGLHP